MNSRGKQLTQFEHFKAELERELKSIDEETAREIHEKQDKLRIQRMEKRHSKKEKTV